MLDYDNSSIRTEIKAPIEENYEYIAARATLLK